MRFEARAAHAKAIVISRVRAAGAFGHHCERHHFGHFVGFIATRIGGDDWEGVRVHAGTITQIQTKRK